VCVCPAGTFGAGCSGTCSCTEMGTCSDGVAGDGSCTCTTGWIGATCDDCDPDALCASGQTLGCVNLEGNVTGLARSGDVALIDAYDPSDSGACVCAQGYYGTTCACSRATTCSGHGVCTGDSTCLCDAKWSGASCGTAVTLDATELAAYDTACLLSGQYCSDAGVCVSGGATRRLIGDEDCTDNSAFVDAFGGGCADWAGHVCQTAHWAFADFTAEDTAALLAACPAACALCLPGSTAAGRFPARKDENPKLAARGEPCVFGYQCRSGVCDPRHRSCKAAKNDELDAASLTHPLAAASYAAGGVCLFDAEDARCIIDADGYPAHEWNPTICCDAEFAAAVAEGTWLALPSQSDARRLQTSYACVCDPASNPSLLGAAFGTHCEATCTNYDLPSLALPTSCGNGVRGACNSDGDCDCAVGYYTDTSVTHPNCDGTCGCSAVGSTQCTSTGECVCEVGWNGTFCDDCIDGYGPPGLCNRDCLAGCGAHGVCNMTHGNCECDCDVLGCFGGVSGDDCSQCAQNYGPAGNCSAFCDPDVTCSGHGTCQLPAGPPYAYECLCDMHYFGADCSNECICDPRVSLSCDDGEDGSGNST
jgi:hypothetical protein